MTHTLDQLRTALADRYEIDREIGSGGMATVYLARDLRNKREVALKVLKPELGAVLGADRFLSEITVTANLQHPNLLPLFDSGEAAGLLFYVMPFVRGETLRARIDRERQLAVDEAVRISVALCGALQCAHENGVIHRDLKPENILMQSGQPVIADFGIALAVSNAGGSRVTQTGLSLGTPQYMSPEQATGEREIDARSDIYSLGAVTYEMLSGEPPHSGASAQAIIAKLMTSEPQPLHTLRATIPMNVGCAVEQALSKLPADRFASAKEFASALQNPAFTIAAKYGHGSAVQSASAKKWKRAAMASAAVAAGLLGVALWALFRPGEPKVVARYVLSLDSSHTLAGALGRAALSPDGERVVYAISPGPALVVRQRDQLEGRVLSGVDQAFSPFFSQDGKRVAYLTPPGSLKVVPLNGGPSVLISDSIYGAGGGSFGPDGLIYASVRLERGIARLAESPGAALKRITRVDRKAGETAHQWPEVLPGGKALLFTIIYGASGAMRAPAIAVADIGTGKYRVITSGVRARYSPSGHLVYATNEGTLMAAPFDTRTQNISGDARAVAQGLRIGAARATDLTVSKNGTLFYVGGNSGVDYVPGWVGRDGKFQALDSMWKGNFASPALSPDGSRLALSITVQEHSDIWIKQLDRGPSLKLTFDGTRNIYPEWTPDGKNITFDGDAADGQDLYTKRADGSSQAVLQLHSSRDMAEAVWSRDGKWLIVRSSTGADGAGDILAMRPGIDSVPTPLLATKFGELTPALSPDGRWLAYSSNETGRREVYVVPFPNVSSAKWPVSNGGGAEPLWAHNGRELFYTSNAGLVSVAVNTGSTFSAGASRVLFPLSGFRRSIARRDYDVSADDKRFLVLRSAGGGASTSLVFVDNWFEELKRK